MADQLEAALLEFRTDLSAETRLPRLTIGREEPRVEGIYQIAHTKTALGLGDTRLNLLDGPAVVNNAAERVCKALMFRISPYQDQALQEHHLVHRRRPRQMAWTARLKLVYRVVRRRQAVRSGRDLFDGLVDEARDLADLRAQATGGCLGDSVHCPKRLTDVVAKQ